MVLSRLRWGLWGALCLAGAAAAAQVERVSGSVGFPAVAALPVPSPVATVRWARRAPACGALSACGAGAGTGCCTGARRLWLNAYGLDHVRALAGASRPRAMRCGPWNIGA